jgi:hypothetical protein
MKVFKIDQRSPSNSQKKVKKNDSYKDESPKKFELVSK